MLELKVVVRVPVEDLSGDEDDVNSIVVLLSIEVDVSTKEAVEDLTVVEAFVVDTESSDEEIETVEDMMEP